ncbi:ATP-binding protein [Holdemanella biformis]|uniref:histidine kinase n=2 Tax=Holdemanella biformis TaxID=1735 RepID=B7C9Y8_9FIRM|nr:ATP-binding protein [Holdemanella biformis]EEC90449.1 diguanylate cyclase (GGDEF) domain protein [Holdemanella biformis DSM 3989]
MQNKKKNRFSKIMRILMTALTSLLIVLILIIILMVSRIQGTARVVNYAGLVRGKTQRIVKLEDARMPQDDMIADVKGYIKGLRFGSEELDLVSLDDKAFQAKMEELDDYFDTLKQEIDLVRQVGYENTNIIEKSEIFFNLCDVATGLAESYSQRIATRLKQFETLTVIDIVILVFMILYELLKALRYAKANRELKSKIYLDEATGLPNKNKCEEILTLEAEQNMAICVFDLNNLRIINNQQGHERGDLYIRSFAKSLRKGVDENQFVGRCGGDEFIVFFKNVTKEDVKRNLENIKKECAKCSEIPLSYAAGFAYSNDFSTLTMRELFCQADKNMYIDKNQAKIKEANHKRNLILNVIQQLKEKGFNFSDCIYCDAKADAYFTLRAGYSFFLAEDGNYSGAIEQILNELFNEDKRKDYRNVLNVDSLNKHVTKDNPIFEIPYYHQLNNTEMKGKIMAVYLDSDEYGNLHHFVLGFKMYSDTVEMDEKKQLMRYYDQLKQSILENANYIEALMNMAQSIFSVNLTQNQIDGIYDKYMQKNKKPVLPCSYETYFKQWKSNVLEDCLGSFSIVESCQNLLDRYKAGDKHVTVEYQIKMPDDRVIWVQEMILMSEETIYDIDIQKERNIVRAIILFRNTSTFHEKEDRDKEKLQLAYQKVDLESKAKTDFMNRMSHDIRTPINGILGMMQIIRKNWGDMDKLDDSLNKMEVLTKHLNELVEDILNMSKLESDHMEIVNEPFDLKCLVEELNSLIDAEISLQNITYHNHMENVVHTHLIGDALQLRRILINLLTNAIKYNKSNGTIDMFVREMSSDDSKVTFEFEIKDTGIGMSEDYIENHLFTPFSQAKQDARTRYEGTGLGMSIVKGLVDKLGGNIDVKSEVGVGTQIKVVLTYQLDTSKNEKQDTSKLDLKDKRILLVEDNEINMEVAEFYLNAVHANVDKAWNGLEAVEKVKEQPNQYSLILMDIMMPKMNGDEGAKCIRKINPSIPIVAMSAQSEYSIDQTIMNDSISKPIDEQKLDQILSKYVA